MVIYSDLKETLDKYTVIGATTGTRCRRRWTKDRENGLDWTGLD